MCRTCGPRRLFVVESPGTFEISHRVGRSLCTFICSSIGVFFLSIAVVTLTLELSLPDCDYHNIGLSCWNEEDSEPRSGGFCGAAVCRSEYVVLEEDHIWTCAVKVPQCPYNGLNWQCPGQCMHEYEDGICSNALHESHEAGSSTLDSATNRTSTNSNNGSNSSSSPILPLPPTPPTPSPAVLMATNEGFWCTDLDCAPCADRVHPRGGVASWGWFTFGGILLLMGVLMGGYFGGCKYEVITVDTTQQDWRVKIVRKAWNCIEQSGRTEIFQPGAKAVTMEFEPGGRAICASQSKIAHLSVGMASISDQDGQGGSGHSENPALTSVTQLVGGTPLMHEEALLLTAQLNRFLDPDGYNPAQTKLRRSLTQESTSLLSADEGAATNKPQNMEVAAALEPRTPLEPSNLEGSKAESRGLTNPSQKVSPRLKTPPRIRLHKG